MKTPKPPGSTNSSDDRYEVPFEEQKAAQDKAEEIPALDEAAYHGVLGEIAKKVEDNSEADARGVLGTMLVGCSNIIGRTLHTSVNDTQHFCNEFICLVGDTARARKGLATDIAEAILRFVDDTWRDHCIVRGFSTGEGLVELVSDEKTKLKKKIDADGNLKWEPEIVRAGVVDKRKLCILPEFGELLTMASREGNNLSAILRQCWDGRSPLEINTKQQPQRATGAHISIVANITKSELLKLLPGVPNADGFCNRFLWFLVTRLKYLPDGGPRVENYLAKEITQLRDRTKFARGLDAICRSEGATQHWHELYNVLSTATDIGRLVVDRAEAHTLRLSQIYAVLDGKSQIEVEHIDAAYAAWRYSEQCAVAIFGVEKLCREAQLVLDHLRANGSCGATRTEIQNRVFHNHKTGNEIQSWLRSLSEKQLAWHSTEKNDHGNLIERWFATKHSNTHSSEPAPQRIAKKSKKPHKPAKKAVDSNEFATNSQKLRTRQVSPRADLRTNSPNSPNSQERNEKEPVLTETTVTLTGDGQTENFIYPANSANSANLFREAASVKDRPIRNSCEFVANSYVYVAKNGEIAGALGVLGGASSLALDTETVCDTLRLVQISDGKNLPLILDAREADLKADLVPLLKEKELIIQNAKFDLRILKNAFGLEIPTSGIFDTYVASALLTNTKVTEELKKRRRRNWHPNSLESIVQRVTGVNLDKTFQSADWSVDLTLPENTPRLEYAANDVRYLHAVRLHLRAELESHNLIPVYELERDLIPCINAMSESGLYVDRDAIDRLAREALDLTAQREAFVLSLLNHKINLRSRKKQLLPALQDLGLTVDGVPLSTTDKNVLPLVDQKDHPVIKAVLEWSTSNEEAKQLAQWPRHIDSDGLVRPQINQFGTVTHRFVYKEPNLQQVKKSQLRSIITAPAGHLIMRADFKTIELIIAAVYYNEANILEQVVKGVDLHKVTAAPMFRVSLDDVLDAQRDVAKTTNFSLLYGRALESYINACRIAGITMSSEELTRIYHDFDKAWPEMAKYRVQLAQQIARRTHPREVRSMYGRRILLDDSLSNREVRGALLNYAIQSSAADVLKLTMFNVWQASPKGVRLLASVHDEILFLLLPDQVKYAKELLREAATDATRRVQKCDIPIQLEIGAGRNWWEAIQDKGDAQ